MATSLGVKRLSVKNILISTSLSVFFIFSLAGGSLSLFSFGEGQRILSYELRTILRSNGKLLQDGDLRMFVEQLPLDNGQFFFEAKSLNVGQDFISGQQDRFKIYQCTTESYLQFSIKFCRHFNFPWKTIFLIGATLLVSFCLFLFLFFRMNRLIVAEFEQLFLIANIPYDGILNFSKAWDTAKNMASLFKSFQEAAIQNERNKVAAEITKQVSHDIRSPLTALNSLLGTLRNIPEDHRVMLRSAANRINDIANQLLKKSTSVSFDEIKLSSSDQFISKSTSVELISALVDVMASEKRIQFRDRNVIIEADIEESYGAFAEIDLIEMKRVISNLVNNSVEAMNRPDGRVVLRVQNNDLKTTISVIDNGGGIPKHVLERLGQAGVTFGKENETASGSGLGIYHAKKTVESLGGQFSIETLESFGTEIVMKFPKPSIPRWFVAELKLSMGQLVIAIDDDKSVLGVYKQRFKDFADQIVFLTLNNEAELQNILTEYLRQTSNALFLFDYEFLGEGSSGLDLIERYGLQKNSVLVTSRYDEPEIRNRCIALNVRQIPKSLISLVPIRIEKLKKKFDAVLIDDDIEIIHAIWIFSAKERNKSILCFKDDFSFFNRSSEIDITTPIYIDVSLANGVSGQNVADKVHDLGFTEIYLSTGYQASDIQHRDYIAGVVGKDFPL